MLRDEVDFRILIARLEIDVRPNPAHCTSLRRQMLAVFNETRRAQRPGVLSADTWRTITGTITSSRAIKVAVAAAIIVTALIGVTLLTRPPELVRELPGVPPQRVKNVPEAQAERIEAMYEDGDVDGLVAVLIEVNFDTQVVAAHYLGEIGNPSALPMLESLHQFAHENRPPGYTENPFAKPIKKIKSRIEPGPDEIELAPDANETPVVDANKVTGPDVNETTTIHVPVQAEGVLEFFVVHKETGEPQAGVKLDITIQREGPDDKRKQVTDKGGHCRIEIGDLRTNRIEIRATKEHFVPLEVKFSKDEGQLRVALPPTYTAALEPGTSIGGFVQDEQGEPIESASVYLQVSAEKVWIVDQELRTDANGFWLCNIIPAKLDYLRIKLTHAEYIDDESYNTRSAPAIEELREMSAVMVMEKGVDIAGQVVDFTGQPIAGADVSQGFGYSRGIKYPRTETDAQGRFEFKSIRPGTVLLTVRANGYAPDLRETMVREGMEPLEFRLGPAQTIRGRVVDSNDEAIEAVEVLLNYWHGHQLIEWETQTDFQGFFEWNEAPKDEMMFGFSKNGYMSIWGLDLSPEVAEYIIVMHRALRVRGSVVDADSNELVAKFKVMPGAKRRGDSWPRWDDDAVGTFTGGRYKTHFSEAYYGYFIRVEADGYLPAISRMFTEEERDVVIDFELEKGKGPSGIVYLPSGEPAAGARVALATPSQSVYIHAGRLPDDKRWQSVTTEPDGRFSFGPQIHRYLVAIVHDQGYAEVTDEELAAEPNIVIQPWGRVEGVLRIGGRALLGESVRLEFYHHYEPNVPAASVRYNGAVTDANGHLAWYRVVPGRVKISHMFRLGGIMATRTRSEIIEVVPGETVNVTIGGTGRAVVGRFVAADPNEPIAWAGGQVSLDLKLPEPPHPNDFNNMIFVERRTEDDRWQKNKQGRLSKKMKWEQARSYRAKIEPDGTFRIDDVPAGEYELRACIGAKPGGRMVWSPRKPAPPPDYEFQILDVNDRYSSEPLDLGVIEIKRKKPLKVGDYAPSLEAETFYGQKINLADYRGKVTVLIFWTSERASIMSHLDGLIKACGIFEANERFVALGMSLDRDAEAAKEFAEENELTWTNCFPAQGTQIRISDDYEIWKFPMTFVIGLDGRILAIEPSPLLLQSTVEDALRQQ